MSFFTKVPYYLEVLRVPLTGLYVYSIASRIPPGQGFRKLVCRFVVLWLVGLLFCRFGESWFGKPFKE